MDHQQVIDKVAELNIQLVTFLYCDNAGTIRGKSVHASGLKKKLHEGMALAQAVQTATVTDEIAPLAEIGPAGEVRLIPDVDTFHPIPWARGRASMIGNLHLPDSSAWNACPRTFLTRMVERARQRGLLVRAAFEPEWYLGHIQDGRFMPLDQGVDNSTVGDMHARRMVDDLVDSMTDLGLGVEQYCVELGPGQQELTIAHAEALTAADNQLLYREAVRNVAFNHGMVATFAPKPMLDQAGSGCHIHLSVWDEQQGENLFYDPHGPHGLSRLAQHWVAGVSAHLPALVALTCASTNSYQRLLPGWWSSAYNCWGVDNREAAIRIPSLFHGREMESANMELRAADATGNPYLALGGLIAAGLDGLDRELPLNYHRMADADPDLMAGPELQRRGIEPLPMTLDRSLDQLEADHLLTKLMGPLLSRSYVAVKRSEASHFRKHGFEYEIAQHLQKY